MKESTPLSPTAPVYDFKTLYFQQKFNPDELQYLKQLISEDTEVIRLLSQNQVSNLLGNPRIIKNQNNVEIWQFRGSCILNIVWVKLPTEITPLEKNHINSPAENTPNHQIAWIEAVALDNAKVSPETCFMTLAYCDAQT